jgi:hypothetical protein
MASRVPQPEPACLWHQATPSIGGKIRYIGSEAKGEPQSRWQLGSYQGRGTKGRSSVRSAQRISRCLMVTFHQLTIVQREAAAVGVLLRFLGLGIFASGKRALRPEIRVRQSCFELRDGGLFAFARLWDRCKAPAWVKSGSILTTTHMLRPQRFTTGCLSFLIPADTICGLTPS